jgi:hypothetical protein
MLYYHNFKCQIHLEAVKFDVAPMRIRYRVTGPKRFSLETPAALSIIDVVHEKTYIKTFHIYTILLYHYQL